MFRLEHEIKVNAPASVVWEVITDLKRYPEWNPFCLTCESSLQPGDPIDMTVKLTSKPQKQREWMMEYYDGRRFAYRMKPVPFGALSSYRSHDIEPVDAGHCIYRSYFHLKGWFKGVVLAMFKDKLEAGFSGMSQAIKNRAEALWAQRQNEGSS